MIRLVNNPTYGNVNSILCEKLKYDTDPGEVNLYKYNNMKEHQISWVCLVYAMKESIDNLTGVSTVEESIDKIKRLDTSDEIKATLLDFYSQMKFVSSKMASADTLDISTYAEELDKKSTLIKKIRNEEITCDPYDQDYGEMEEEEDAEAGVQIIMDLSMQNKALSDQLEILKKRIEDLTKSVNTINDSVSDLEGNMKEMSLTSV